ncbi:MAG: hypothetical protein ACON5C_09380 [Alphaproteobacteria bacterium]
MPYLDYQQIEREALASSITREDFNWFNAVLSETEGLITDEFSIFTRYLDDIPIAYCEVLKSDKVADTFFLRSLGSSLASDYIARLSISVNSDKFSYIIGLTSNRLLEVQKENSNRLNGGNSKRKSFKKDIKKLKSPTPDILARTFVEDHADKISKTYASLVRSAANARI